MSPITPSISVNEPNPQAAIQTLSVVVPIYNEVDSIPHLVESIATILRSYQINYEIICHGTDNRYPRRRFTERSQ